MHGRTHLLAGIAVTQDIMPSTVLILIHLSLKAPKILGAAVRIRVKTRAVESAQVQMNQARRGADLHGSHPEVRPALRQRKMIRFVATMMSDSKRGSVRSETLSSEDLSFSEPGARTRALQSYRTAALFQVLTEAMSVATVQVT